MCQREGAHVGKEALPSAEEARASIACCMNTMCSGSDILSFSEHVVALSFLDDPSLDVSDGGKQRDCLSPPGRRFWHVATHPLLLLATDSAQGVEMPSDCDIG